MNKLFQILLKSTAIFQFAVLAFAPSAQAAAWSYAAWTGDADSGIDGGDTYTVAVNLGGPAVTVNGVPFEASTLSGPNFSIGGNVITYNGDANNILPGDSKTLSKDFIYNGTPRTITLNNLTPGLTYETTFFSVGWDAIGGRQQTFDAAGIDSLEIDQDSYDNDNGIRISYLFVAGASSMEFTITPLGANTFHLYALANRRVTTTPKAKILSFGPGAVIGQPAGNAASIAWTVPFEGTDVTKLAPTFTLTDGATVTVGGNPVVSGTQFNFTSPVHYIVKSSDGLIVNDYTVTVTVAPQQVPEVDHAATFAQGSTGYQSNIVSKALNLLASPDTILTLSGGAPANPSSAGGASTNYSTLVNGSFGTVPPTGGGGPGAVYVENGWILTYTLAASYNINTIDTFSGWGDGGRIQQDYTVSYATEADPTTFIPLATVAYHPGGNSTWVRLSPAIAVHAKVIQFSFGNQQNGGVGYTELVVQGTLLPWSYAAWTGDEDSGIDSKHSYTVAVNLAGPEVSVNGVPFEASTLAGANFSIGGGVAVYNNDVNNVGTGDSMVLATDFIYNGTPRTVTLTNLTPGQKYKTTFFSVGWDNVGNRQQTFASGSDSMVVDQDFFDNNNGIRISYAFVAAASSQLITITPLGANTFHLYALANRTDDSTPQAKIVNFGPGASISAFTGNAATIALTVPFEGTDLTKLAPTFTLSSGATATVGGNPVVSGTQFNFTSPVHYIVKSSDNLIVNDYTVTVTLAPPLAVEVDHAATFTQGTAGYQSNIVSKALNLLASPDTILTLSGGAPANPSSAGGASTNYSTLVNGSFGTVPPTGGGGPGAVYVENGWILTYTLAASYNINTIDTFSGWGDGGRIQQDYTVSYATEADPTTFILFATVAYHPGGNSTWVHLTPATTVQAKVIQFAFANQQNGGVGYTELVVQGTLLPWSYAAWTGDEDSGIVSNSTYTVAVNLGGPEVSVNGVPFEASTLAGANFSIGGGIATFNNDVNNVAAGDSQTLATDFIYNGTPRTVTLNNLTPGLTYKTTFFSVGWDARGARQQTFASGSDSMVVDQDFFDNNNGIRISYTFEAAASSQLITISPLGANTFHLYALANRQVVTPPRANIVGFGPGAVIGQPVGSTANIAWTVPFGTDVTKLAPTFTLSSGATSKVAGNTVVSGAQFNFTSPVHYIVTSSDGQIVNDYTVTVTVAPFGLWSYVAWTGDADSGIDGGSIYTVAVNLGGPAVSVNGVPFQASTLSGPNFSIGGGVSTFNNDGNNILPGDSKRLATDFIYNGTPRTVTLSNLTPGLTYEATFFSVGWDAIGARPQTFASGIYSLEVDQDSFDNDNGIRISFAFVAASSSQLITITPLGANTFHLYALANRQVATTPRIGYSRSGNQLTLGWNGSGKLQQKTSLNNPVGWTDVPNGGTSPVTLTIGVGNLYFRVQQ